MATNKRPFTMRMQPKNFDKIRVIAAVNKRSVAMQIEYLMEKCIEEYEGKHGTIPLIENNVAINTGTINNNVTTITKKE